MMRIGSRSVSAVIVRCGVVWDSMGDYGEMRIRFGLQDRTTRTWCEERDEVITMECY